MKYFSKLILSFIIIIILSVGQVFSHSVQVQWCVSCSGDLRIWLEHWHGSEDPNSTTMTISVTVNGTTSTITSSPGGGVLQMTPGQLPGCSTPIAYAAGCPTEENTWNDWVYYDFPGLPTNVPLSFTIISGNTQFTQDCCNPCMYPLTVNFNINTLNSLVDQNICYGNLTTPITMDNSATWINSNPLIGLPASGTGSIPPFIPVGDAGATAIITYVNECSAGSFEFTILPQFTITYSESDYNGYNISCNGYSDGGINLSLTGGSGYYSYLWSNGATTEDLTSLYNGTYIVDVRDSNSCTMSTAFTLTEPASLLLTSNFTYDTCNRDGGMAEVIISGGVFPYNYLWSDNQITPLINNLYGGNYSVIITDANNCKISEQFYINPGLFVDPIAEFNVVPDLKMHHLNRQIDNPIFFIDKSVDEFTIITKWFWEFEDGFSSNNQDPKHSFEEIGDFNVTLAIENLYGCADTITKRVIIEEFVLYIPSSFTPQDDGVNDVFLPKGIGMEDYELKIYNRWGKHFFTSDDLNVGWNGTTDRKDKTAQIGVYVYLINVIDIFGHKHTYNGLVTLAK